jgi:hypothetical protein
MSDNPEEIARWWLSAPVGKPVSQKALDAVRQLLTLVAERTTERAAMQRRAESAEADWQDAERRLARVTPYVEHRKDCLMVCCKVCWCSLTGGNHSDKYNGNTTWHPFEMSACTCGLDTALSEATS